MKSVLASALTLTCAVSALAADTLCYELRIYHAAPGKLDALNARFREHSCALLEKHGFTNIGYWVPMDNKDNLLIYVISGPNREAHDKAWNEFAADPELVALMRALRYADGFSLLIVIADHVSHVDRVIDRLSRQFGEPLTYDLSTDSADVRATGTMF